MFEQEISSLYNEKNNFDTVSRLLLDKVTLEFYNRYHTNKIHFDRYDCPSVLYVYDDDDVRTANVIYIDFCIENNRVYYDNCKIILPYESSQVLDVEMYDLEYSPLDIIPFIVQQINNGIYDLREEE